MTTLHVLPDRLAVCRLPADSAIPGWAIDSPFFSVTRTPDELSVVCREGSVPMETKSEGGWRALQVAGPLDFALTGVLASIAAPLASAGVSIFAIATFDTDYVLVKEDHLAKATAALAAAGHTVIA